MIDVLRRQPAVTDMAAVGSLGSDWQSIWNGLISGRTAAVPFEKIDLPFDVDAWVSAIEGLQRQVSQKSFGAACRIGRSVLDQFDLDGSDRVRFYGASNHGETDILLRLTEVMPEGSSLWQTLLIDPMPDHVLGGRGIWTYSACTSAMHALVTALLDGEDGDASDAVVVSADALSSIGVAGFWRSGATARGECLPFAENRDGILIGEGGAALRLSFSSARSADEIRVLGFGMSCDAVHPTDPEPTGAWLERAIRDSLDRSGVDTSDIAAVISHGTGTLKNDAVESLVYKRLWPASDIPVTSIKGGLGHTMGAAGLFNVLAAIESSRTGIVPPVAGDRSDVPFDIDVVTKTPRSINVGAPVLAVASGFGGNNVAFVGGSRR